VLPVLAELSLPALAAVVAGLMLVDGTPLVGLLIPGDLVVVSASTVEGWPAVLVAVVAWTAALVLIILVMVLNLTARLIARLFAPKTAGR